MHSADYGHLSVYTEREIPTYATSIVTYLHDDAESSGLMGACILGVDMQKGAQGELAPLALGILLYIWQFA